MRRNDIEIGMLLNAWTSLWGEHIIEVTKITNERPARIQGKIVKTLKEGYGFRAGRLQAGMEIDVGIISVRKPTKTQLEGI